MLVLASFVVGIALSVTLDDPATIWKALARTTSCNGTVDRDGWVFACFQEAADPLAKGFEDLQRSGAQQEAIDILVTHCCGVPEIPKDLKPAVSELLKLSIDDRWSYRVSTAGVLWVEVVAPQSETRAVVALPSRACAVMPAREYWRSEGLAITEASESWLIPAALLEVPKISDRDQIKAILETRVRALLPEATKGWPAGWTKFPEGIPKAPLAALTLNDLLKVASSRPGDMALWGESIGRVKADGFVEAATALQVSVRALAWLPPSPLPQNVEWSHVVVDELPTALIATIRSGGSIVCLAAPPSAETARAKAAFFAATPDLATAELEAIAACQQPDADALNLLAAIRLSSPNATPNQLQQALAFSRQAMLLTPNHPFAPINRVRALQRLGMTEQVVDALKALPPYTQGSWQDKQVGIVRSSIESAAPQ